MPELCVLPSPFLSAVCPSLSLSLSLFLFLFLSLCLYLFAISLCASPRRVLTANNAPRDALENIHFSCRGEAREPRVAFEIYFPLKLPMHRTLSSLLPRERGPSPADLSDVSPTAAATRSSGNLFTCPRTRSWAIWWLLELLRVARWFRRMISDPFYKFLLCFTTSCGFLQQEL